MPKLIIVEGPDFTGKTTLSLAIAKACNGIYIHSTCTPALQGAMHDYMRSQAKNVSVNVKLGGSRPPVIMDRSWPSEYVYGSILRPDSRWKETVNDIRPVLEACEPTYVFCVRENIVDLHSDNKDNDHPYTKRQFAKIVSAYNSLVADMMSDFFLRDRVRLFDCDKDSTENFISTIL